MSATKGRAMACPYNSEVPFYAGALEDRNVTQSVSERAHSWIMIPWDSMNSRMRLRGQPEVQ